MRSLQIARGAAPDSVPRTQGRPNVYASCKSQDRRLPYIEALLGDFAFMWVYPQGNIILEAVFVFSELF